jgi:serine protease inhibitor
VTVRMVNRAYVADGVTLNHQFLQTIHEKLEAITRKVDFSSPSTMETINHWVEETTEGRITNLVDPGMCTEWNIQMC